MAALFPDLVSEVLLRLPVRALLRFRCLSKSSRTEIDSTDFVKNHLKRSVRCNASQKLIMKCADYCHFYFAGFDDDLQHTFPLNNPLRSQHRSTLVRGSCNGLILLDTTVNKYQSIINLVLWNPFTRRYKKLPFSPPISGDFNFIGYGLGYDSALHDYKIVLISRFINGNSVSSQVWIFSLKSNSWRHGPDVEYEPTKPVGLFADGALYWENHVSFKSKWVGFDLTGDLFFDLPKFPDCGPETVRIHNLMVLLGGHLSTATVHTTHPTIEFYILVSGKGGDVASGNWRKEFTLHAGEIIIRDSILPLPVAYSKRGDRILLKEKDNRLLWYNREKKTFQRVETADKCSFHGFPIHYVSCESLVSLGNDSAFDGGATDDLYPF